MLKLSPNKRKELMVALCRAIATLKKADEVAEFLLDFLSPQENETLAKRLRIAELLAKGENYHSIRTEVSVGYSTIARVNTWLNLSGKGFRLVLSRKKSEPKEISEDEKYDPYSWHNIKRRYSMHFWPQLLLEELLKQSSENEKEKIKKVLDGLDIKTKTFTKEANKMLYNQFTKSLTQHKSQ